MFAGLGAPMTVTGAHDQRPADGLPVPSHDAAEADTMRRPRARRPLPAARGRATPSASLSARRADRVSLGRIEGRRGANDSLRDGRVRGAGARLLAPLACAVPRGRRRNLYLVRSVVSPRPSCSSPSTCPR
jgi:hypothetical protein